jgi:hypothetical protein
MNQSNVVSTEDEIDKVFSSYHSFSLNRMRQVWVSGL